EPNTTSIGETIEYTINLTNYGNGTAYDVTLNDTLPENLTYQISDINDIYSDCNISAYNIANNADGSSNLIINMDEISPGTMCTFRYNVSVNTLASPGEYTNFVKVYTQCTIEDPPANPDIINVTGNVTLTVEAGINITLTKQATEIFLAPDSTVPYILNLTNTGTNAADNVTIADNIPLGLSYQISSLADINTDCNISGYNVQPTANGEILTIILNALPANSSCTLMYNVTIPGDVAMNAYTNYVNATAMKSGATANASADETIYVLKSFKIGCDMSELTATLANAADEEELAQILISESEKSGNDFDKMSGYDPGTDMTYCIFIINLENNGIASLLDILPNATINVPNANFDFTYQAQTWDVPAEYGTISDYLNGATTNIQGNRFLPDWSHVANWSNITVPGILDTGNLFDSVTMFNVNVTIDTNTENGVYINTANISYNNKTESVEGKVKVPRCWGIINGTVFDDINRNGIQDNGENGIANVDIVLTNTQTNKTYYAVTNNGGIYEIRVPCGNYTLTIDTGTVSENLNCEKIANTTPSEISTETLENTTTINFGFTCICSAISIEKTPSQAEIICEGNVTYYYNVTNTGCSNLTEINVTDDKCLNVACSKDTLAVNESIMCNCTTTINETTTNIATVTANDEDNLTLTASDSATVEVICNSNISINKTANTTQINIGESVTYFYNVTNTGNLNLANITVSDDKCSSVICPKNTLA
ncbi:MAG: hypothetical protein CVT89_03745, partial [Candidatus Altiarchaeales archaeon HGW-Altiarchaeales-2]